MANQLSLIRHSQFQIGFRLAEHRLDIRLVHQRRADLLAEFHEFDLADGWEAGAAGIR
jgi:hypothetical protein